MRDEVEGTVCCSVVPIEITNNGLWSLKNIKFHPNRRKHAFTVGVAEHWNRLSREIDSWPQRFQYQGDIKNLTGHGAGKNTFGVPA